MLYFFRLTPKKRRVLIKSKKGIIYSNPSGKKRYFFYFGNFIFIGALVYFVYLYLPLGKAVFDYKFHKSKTNTEAEIEIRNISTDMNNDQFIIQIPKIMADSQVVKNVSPFLPEEYLKVLENDVIAQAKGTDLPGEGVGKATYLFAHSTRQGIGMVRKNSVFYLLGDLSNDDVIFIRYNGKIYKYRIYMKKVVDASEVDYIKYKDPSKEIIIMQTCWPIGTDWRRLLVFAERF
jgi:LPXTG-site transpeptidase (sortase) family protein